MRMRTQKKQSAGLAAPAEQSTRMRILDVAEVLFAERGVDAVSIREITSKAKVNAAAAHYHFGSKQAILEELFALRAKPIADKRMALLEGVRLDDEGRPVLEDVLRAFLLPALQVPAPSAGGSFTVLRARIVFERQEVRRAAVWKIFDESTKKTVELLARALPLLSPDELYWRFHFLLGAMMYTMAASGRIDAVADGQIDTSDPSKALEELTHFAASGFRSGSRAP